MARSVCILDTSILCELLQVPNLCSRFEEVIEKMDAKVRNKEILLLPLVAVLETGNHIGQNGNGQIRRSTAERFVKTVEDALRGRAPFAPIRPIEIETLVEWLSDFPDWVQRNDAKGKGSGLGDLTIVKEWERQRRLNPHSRVYIWSFDLHLSSYNQR